MRIPDPELLEEIGLTLYERKALVTLMVFGVADAAAVCREGDVPTSKIYRAMEKLAQLGLVQLQPTRPKMYAALPADAVADRLVEIARERAERFASGARDLRQLFASLPGRVRGKQTFLDLALGAESHVKRHLVHLAAAREGIVSYMERGDLQSIDAAVAGGFPILRRIARNAAEKKVRHQVVFGFSYRSAPQLLEFLRKHKAEIRHLTGVRYSGELGHPFHVVDREVVVLPLDHPFVPEGRLASLLIRDAELASNLAEGFENLWRKAMRSLQEINVDPRSREEPALDEYRRGRSLPYCRVAAFGHGELRRRPSSLARPRAPRHRAGLVRRDDVRVGRGVSLSRHASPRLADSFPPQLRRGQPAVLRP